MSDSVEHEIRALESILGSERDPDGLAFAPLADAFRRKGDIRKAFDLLQDGTSRHPDFATGHVVTAQLYVDWGFPAEAELAARRVLELDSENIVALSILGAILDERGDDEAGAVHAVLVGADPESEQARAVAEQPDDEVTPPVGVDADLGDRLPEEYQHADESVEEPVLTLNDLAPLPTDPEIEEVMDLGALAPDPEPEPIVEDVMDLGALAPDPEPEPIVEDVMDLGALAPDPEPEPIVEDVMDLGALAPDSEPEPIVEDVMDLGALAPDPEPEPIVEDVMDLGALAPDPEPEPVVEDVMDLGALAPDPEPEPVVEDVMDLGALAPDPDTLAAAALEPADPSEEDPHVDSSEPVNTRTLAELYVSQGFTDKAIDVYRQLQVAEPDAGDLEARIAELEGRAPAGRADVEAAADVSSLEADVSAPEDVETAPDEEVETLARDLAETGADHHEVDTPFAWSEDVADEESAVVDSGMTIGAYFDQLLSWEEDGE